MSRWAALGLLALAGLAALAGLRWVSVAAPVGTAFAARVTCSLAHVSGQPLDGFRDYVEAEVYPLPRLGLELAVEEDGARASSFGGIFRARAVHRRGLGCTLLVGGGEATAGAASGVEPAARRTSPSLPWPEGKAGPAAAPAPAVAAALERAFSEPGPPLHRRTKAVVVAQDGRLVAERFAPGYGPDTPMLSWSMAKSVTMALIGALVREGAFDPARPAPVPEWRGAGDPRGAITLDHLLRQSSGLDWDETLNATSDVSRMLFLEPDAGAFAAAVPLAEPPDTRWYYSSGTSNLVARIVRDHFGGDPVAQARGARRLLFEPLGITSAVLELDASGSFIGSSFAFLSARDWARFGELFRREGVWNGRRVLPEGWAEYARTPTPAAPRGEYGAHWWLNAGPPGAPEERRWPALPPDTYAARGHSGQWVVVVPSARLVVVRLGLTTPDVESQDGTEALVAELLRALD